MKWDTFFRLCRDTVKYTRRGIVVAFAWNARAYGYSSDKKWRDASTRASSTPTSFIRVCIYIDTKYSRRRISFMKIDSDECGINCELTRKSQRRRLQQKKRKARIDEKARGMMCRLWKSEKHTHTMRGKRKWNFLRMHMYLHGRGRAPKQLWQTHDTSMCRTDSLYIVLGNSRLSASSFLSHNWSVYRINIRLHIGTWI